MEKVVNILKIINMSTIRMKNKMEKFIKHTMHLQTIIQVKDTNQYQMICIQNQQMDI